MKIKEIDKIVGYLGKSYDELLGDPIFSESALNEIYPGSERLYISPEDGLEMDFSVDEKILTEFFITLKKTAPSTSVYKGDLPDPLALEMNKEMVIKLFGEPIESRYSILLPQPIGQTGGWASYRYDEIRFSGVILEFQYSADMSVKTLVFYLDR